MTRRRLPYAATLVALAAACVVAFALPATAAQRTVRVRTALGQVITVTVDAPCGPISSIPGLPGTPIEDLTPPGECNGGGGGGGGGSSQPQQQPTQTQQQTQTQTQTSGGGGGGSKHHSGSSPSSHGGHSQHHAHSKGHAKNHNPQAGVQGGAGGKGGSHRHHGGGGGGLGGGGTPGGPPTFFDALPGPSQVTGVPNLVLNHFDIPIFLLPIYEAAGTQYGVRWEVLAAINQVETNFGRNLSVSSAGAEGWMQFMPSTWKTWGVDANGDKTRDPYNPPDAIFSAARYLKAAGAEKDIRKAIFAYNHAGWYVDGVMLRARVFAAYPPNFVGALTGLTQARFPVAARAKYKNQVSKPTSKKLKPGANAANVVSADPSQRAIDIFAKPNAPVVAANDGVVKKVGASPSRGKYVVLQDVYGNTYTYSQLGSVQPVYPVPKNITKPNKAAAKALAANAFQQKDPTPTAPASAGTQTPNAPRAAAPPKKQRAPAKPAKRSPAAAASQVTYKARLFAHPRRANASKAGGLEQVFDRQTNNGDYSTFDSYFAHGVIHLSRRDASLKPLKKGSRVIGGTILGHVGGATPGKAPHLNFQVQPAGKGAPQIDPKPILDGWKLLASTNIYRASGKDALYGSSTSMSVGQVLLLPKPLLQQRVLNDPRVKIYPCGRGDIATGQIDQRVLATIEYLAESGLDPTITSLKCGHSDMTASGNVSEHSTGDAVDIGAINGTPILNHQGAGSITEVTVKRLMLLQGANQPHQIISLMDFGGNTLALPDHYNHIHVGFHPLLGENAKLGQQTASIMGAGQWDKLVAHLGELSNPVVPTKPSKAALPVSPPGIKHGD